MTTDALRATKLKLSHGSSTHGRATCAPAETLRRHRHRRRGGGSGFHPLLPPELRIALLTKGVLGESNTRYAQGGLSAAVGADDSPALHAADTLAAGAGLSDAEAVARLVEGAPEAVRWLTTLGARFDAGPNGEMLLGREAAHSRRRVLHAGGDATGAEIERSLVARVRADRNVDLFPGAFVVDLVVVDGRCRGVLAEVEPGGPLTVLVGSGNGARRRRRRPSLGDDIEPRGGDRRRSGHGVTGRSDRRRYGVRPVSPDGAGAPG